MNILLIPGALLMGVLSAKAIATVTPEDIAELETFLTEKVRGARKDEKNDR